MFYSLPVLEMFNVCFVLDSLQCKRFWMSPQYMREGLAGNDMSRTNVPDIRIAFRYETFLEELSTLFHTARRLIVDG